MIELVHTYTYTRTHTNAHTRHTHVIHTSYIRHTHVIHTSYICYPFIGIDTRKCNTKIPYESPPFIIISFFLVEMKHILPDIFTR